MAKERQGFAPSSGDRNKTSNLQGSENLPDEVIIDLDAKDPEEYEIVVEDDTPEDDKGKPADLDDIEGYVAADDDDEPIKNKAHVKKRIDRLKFEMNTERRGKEAAVGERDAAVKLAADQAKELDQLRSMQERNNVALARTMASRNDEAMKSAQSNLANAHADGDADEIAKATASMSKLAAEGERIKAATPPEPSKAPPAPAAPAAPAPAPQAAAPQMAPNVAAWLAKNDSWFSKPGNEAKTNFAMSLHTDLVNRGVAPSTSEYTQELDKGLKTVYSEHVSFNTSAQNDGDENSSNGPKRTNNVATGSRENTQNKNSRQVTLSQSELAIAKRLRLTPQAYAKAKRERELRTGA